MVASVLSINTAHISARDPIYACIYVRVRARCTLDPNADHPPSEAWDDGQAERQRHTGERRRAPPLVCMYVRLCAAPRWAERCDAVCVRARCNLQQ